MTSTAPISEQLREQIISQPETILDDHDMMRALIAANERTMGANIVDLRGIAMERLESRLDRLEDTHRSVIAAAYENLAGMNLIHRAVLRMLDPTDFETFVKDLGSEVAELGDRLVDLLLRGNNLTNEEARNHVSFLKDSVPLPGRDIGLSVRFWWEGSFGTLAANYQRFIDDTALDPAPRTGWPPLWPRSCR